MVEEKFVVIETDIGLDDALALMLTIRAHRDPLIPIRIVGIICVHGNSDVNQVMANMAIFQKNFGGDNIPIFKGASSPILNPYKHKKEPYCGFNGFGDVDFPFQEPSLDFQDENGTLALIRLSHEYKGKLTLIELGPLTNLALATKLDPSIKENIKEIWAMGGNIEGIGNTSVCGEFNFFVDPEAAYIALSSFKCPFYIIPWEVCQRSVLPYDWRMGILGKIETPEMKFLNIIEEKSLKMFCKDAHEDWIPCDSYVTAALIEPKMIKRLKHHYCTVELQGNHTRGLMVVDHFLHLGEKENVQIIAEVDLEIFKKILIWGVRGLLNYPNF